MLKFIFLVTLFCWRDTINRDPFIFWNVENFYDWINDSSKVDDFHYRGKMRWSYNRYIEKRNLLAKVLLDFSYPDYPTFIGLVEVENRFVLNQLVYKTPLVKGDYGIVHKDSPDFRGIDVALLYRKALFRPIKSIFYPLLSSCGDTIKTREILYCKGILRGTDTLHILVNHWPSKYSGERVSKKNRSIASVRLHSICDSILFADSFSNIIVCGDFNDIEEVKIFDDLKELLVKVKLVSKYRGTIKFRGNWQEIDMFFISNNIFNKYQKPDINPNYVESHCVDYLMEKDVRYTHLKPYRTYIGPRYKGGISDHLPIKIILISSNLSLSL